MGPGRDFAGWLRHLAAVHGVEYLLAVFCFHHVLKGFVLVYTLTSLDWVLKSFHVHGPQIQVLRMIALMPWVLKPVLGITSDLFPIGGYSKAPYIIGATAIGLASYTLVGFHGHGLSLSITVLAFIGMSVQIAMCDLLTEAATAERLRQRPDMGPSVIAFVHGGMKLGEVLATATVGTTLSVLGPRGPCFVCILPSAIMLIPAVGNFLGEYRRDASTSAKRRATILRTQPEVLLLVGVVGLGSFAISAAASLTSLGSGTRFELAGVTMLLILGSFVLLLNPVIGNLNAFLFLQCLSTISVDGGSFYFFTDDECSFPIGPHFTVWFYTTGLGLTASLCGLLGVSIYNQYLSCLRFRSVLLISNVLWCLVSVITASVYTRRNVTYGIPDRLFMLTGTVFQNIFERWIFLPGAMLLAQVCPRGMEATMLSLLVGCQNLARALSSLFGSFLLSYLGVDPDGTARDKTQFRNLWLAAVCQALLPLLTLLLVPHLVPDAAQTDRIMDAPSAASNGEEPEEASCDFETATRSSPWRTLMRRNLGGS